MVAKACTSCIMFNRSRCLLLSLLHLQPVKRKTFKSVGIFLLVLMIELLLSDFLSPTEKFPEQCCIKISCLSNDAELWVKGDIPNHYLCFSDPPMSLTDSKHKTYNNVT